MKHRKQRPPEAQGRKQGRAKKRERNAKRGAYRCGSGKRRFRDHAEAVSALRNGREKPTGDNQYVPVRAYECDTCGGWHLTSRPLPTIDDGEEAA